MYFRKYQLVREKIATYNAVGIDKSANDTESIAQLLNLTGITKSDQEKMITIVLDAKLKVSGFFEISAGTIDSAPVHPREIFKPAIATPNCAAVIVAHNHPSGDTTPSKEDITVTNRLIDAGNILGIKVLDHIVISEESYTSIRALGICQF